MNPFFVLLVGATVALFGSQHAHAGRGIDRATGQAVWDAAVNGRTTRIGTGAGAMKVVGPAGATSAAGGGAAKVTGQAKVPVADKEVPVGISGEVAKDAIVGGVVGCATGGLLGCALGVGVPLATAYFSLSGARVNPDTGALEKTDPELCYVGPCYDYRGPYGPVEVYYSTPTAACEATVAAANASGGSPPWVLVSVVGTGNYNFSCKPKLGSDSNFSWPLQKRSAAPKSPTWYPATPQEVRDQLYKKDPDPGIVDELSKYGNITWPLGNVKLTGPAEISGPKTTSTTQSGNRTDRTVSQERTPLSYSGDSVTAGSPIRTSTTTSTTTNPDGTTSTSTSTTTETTEPGDSGSETPEGVPTDTALPEVPKLYDRKYPQGMEGIWNEKKAQLLNTPLASLPGRLMPVGYTSGQCPTWTIPLDMAGFHDWGVADVSPPCWLWDVARVIIILGALILARALIFGG